MPLPTWLKKPDASADELREQLVAARGEHATALESVSEAVAAFDVEPSPAAEKRLLAARETAQRAEEHVARAERLLEAACARENAAEQERLRARAEELRPMLRHHGVMGRLQPLLDVEVDLLVRVAEIRADRRALYAELSGLLSEYQNNQRELGESPQIDDRIDYARSHVHVRNALQARIAELPGGDEMRSLLRALLPEPDAYHHDANYIREPLAAE